jgi:holo-[acyl-carrier protein] synthase
VVSAESGAPSLRLAGRAAEIAAERGIVRIHLSLTHTDDTAAAFVVLEAG